MKKIIFFSKNLEIGGMEKALVSLLNHLCKKYFVTLVLEEKKGILLNDLDETIIVEEYKMSRSKNVLFRKVDNFVRRTLWTMKYKDCYDFSCNYATYSVIGSRLAQNASKNSSFYIHSDYYDMYGGDIKKIDSFFTPHHLEKYKNIIFVSNESRNKLMNIYPQCRDNSFVINNLISYNSIRALANEHLDTNFEKDNVNLLFIGRLENESKNFDLLIESFKLISKQNSKYKLYIIGDGAYKTNIEKQIAQNNLGSSVIMLGQKKNPYPYIKACDAIIFTSNYEGFPVTYLEALVLNKQIFSTVVMSDESIDMRDFVIQLKREPQKIANDILNYLSKHLTKNDLDFELLNEKKIKMIEDLIEV